MSQPDFKKMFQTLQAKGFDFDKTFMALEPEEMALLCASVQEAMPHYSLPYLKYVASGEQVLVIPADAPPDMRWWEHKGDAGGVALMRKMLTELGATAQTLAAYGCTDPDGVPF